MAAAAALQQALTADLALLGGVPLTVTSSKSPLTWSARSVSTEAEWGRDAKKDGRQLTGQVFASVEVSIRLRDFDRLGAVTQALARHEDFNLSRAHWQADDDNSGWPGVRAAAIEAAVRKGRDYAASLGGALTAVDHVADVGLLGGGLLGGGLLGGGGEPVPWVMAASARAGGVPGDDGTPRPPLPRPPPSPDVPRSP